MVNFREDFSDVLGHNELNKLAEGAGEGVATRDTSFHLGSAETELLSGTQIVGGVVEGVSSEGEEGNEDDGFHYMN